MIIKDYKVNEAVLVTHYTLDALYQKYCWNYPHKINKKVISLLDDLKKELDGQQDKDYRKYDIEKCYYMERIEFNDQSD